MRDDHTGQTEAYEKQARENARATINGYAGSPAQ